jgi:succinate dehydrogenase/fumarate reductase flavoprotein subunit
MGEKRQGLTGRQVIVGAGALSIGAVTLRSSRAESALQWDHETDILVVGSGVGASTAAITAHENGDAVMVLEKAPITGGTSAKSAGVLWIPDNFTLKAKGIEDRKEDCLKYMARFSYPESYNPADPILGLSTREFELLEAFYDNASRSVDSLRGQDALNVAEWRMFFLDRPATDYLDHVPENKVPAGRAIGPLKEDGSMGGGADLMRQLNGAVKERGIPLLTNHRAMRLILNREGRVIGLEAETGDSTVRIRARKAAIFGTGGYVHNPEFVGMYQASRLWGSCAMPWATGDFINMAGAAGARMGIMSSAWRTQVLLEEALQSSKLAAGVFFPAGDSMLQVNRYGVRVVNENRNYNDRTEAHGVYDPSSAEFPNQLLFMIYDQRSAQAFAGVYPIPADPENTNYTIKGDSLADLAEKIDARLGEIAAQTGGVSLAPSFTANLEKTIKRFNGFARSGKDEDFQRGKAAYDSEWHQVFSPMKADSGWPANEGPSITMHPLRDEGPYYAMILAAGALDTCGGPAIDASARVLDTGDKPIPGLYGVGNCIGSPSGEAYWGAGHTLGLSLTFGFIAANAAHDESPENA